MAIVTSREKESGGDASLSVPYLVVENDVGTLLSLEDAIDAAAAEGLADQGSAASGYSHQRISDRSFRITLQYKPAEVPKRTPPPVGEETLDYRFNFQAQSRFAYLAKEHIASYDSSGEIGLATNAINIRYCGGAYTVAGMEVTPAPEVFTLDYTTSNAIITAAYQLRIAELCGRWNATTFRGFAAGQIQLVRAGGQKRTDEDWHLSIGFGYAPNEENFVIRATTGGNITIPFLKGHHLLWTVDREVFDTATGAALVEPRHAVVQRVWDEDELNDLNLPL